jgi:subtilase family serine protease
VSVTRQAFQAVAIAIILVLFPVPLARTFVQTVTVAQNHPEDVTSLTGRAAADRPLTLHIAFALRDRPKLDALLAAQQNPFSPKFHQWLMPAQFDQRFGRTTDEVRAVSRWLTDNGFQVSEASVLGLTAYGTALFAENAFHTTIAESPDGSLYANLSDPEIPSEFEGVIGAIDGLGNTRHSMPMIQQAIDSRFALFPAVPASPARKGAIHPAGSPDHSGGSGNAFGPADFWTFYDENTLLNAGTNGGGAGCIAVIEDSNYLASAVNLFDSTFGLPAASVTNVFADKTNPGINGSEVEVLLDIEWAHAVADGAPIRVYIGSGNNALPQAIRRAVRDNACSTISISYSFCGGNSAFFTGTLHPLFAQAASQGQSVFVSSGDRGSAGLILRGNSCVAGTNRNVSEMSADPNVTAVGGTQFRAAYDSSGNVTGTIAESVWNDSSGATGGGKSKIFRKPSFQTASTPSDGKRDVPDVAFGASLIYPGYYFGNDSKGVPLLDCCVGGTSVAAPMWAGLIALINQSSGRVGNIDTRLYQLGPSGLSAGLRNVTTANDTNNDSPGNNAYRKVPGFSAAAGYDQATGWGSADVTNFVEAFVAFSESPKLTPSVDR